jgi:hypothetical protein
MTISKSRCTAYHEAAHAVIYLLFGIDVEQITLSCCGEGVCSVADDLPPSNGRLIAILAGKEAEKVLLGGDLDALSSRESGWKTDLERAGELFHRLNRRDGIEDAVAESSNLVKQNWHTIRSLAELLIRASQANFEEGDSQYIMSSSELKHHVERFRAEATGSL